MNKIVILGGGFAGIAAAKHLLKHKQESLEIVLIDKNSYHLFTPSLYEVATNEEPKKNIAIPFSEIFEKKIKTINAEIEKIDPKNKKIILKDGQSVDFDFLVISLGSETAYYNIEGLRENSVTLKSLEDAVKLRNSIKTRCCKEGVCNRIVEVLIGGGGFAGTELAAELLSYKQRLAKQHHLDPGCLHVSVIQGSNRLLKELDEHVSKIAQKRMDGKQTSFYFGGHIKSVTKKEVTTDDGKSYPYEVLVWTGGVKANHIASDSELPVDKHGEILVNQYLQVQGYPNIFAAGDISGFVDAKTQEVVPDVAQVAEDEGKIAGENIHNIISNRNLVPYHYRHFGYVVPIKGRFAVAELMFGIHFDGIFGWILQQFVLFRYLLGILSLPKAIMRWNKFEINLSQ